MSDAHYATGVMRGRIEGLQVLLLETQAWIKLAREKRGNELLVALAIVDAFKDLTERFQKELAKEVAKLEGATACTCASPRPLGGRGHFPYCKLSGS